MMPVGDGSFYLYLHGDVRKASGTKVGDRVRVEAGFDSKYRNGPQHPVPSWFRSALAGRDASWLGGGIKELSRGRPQLRGSDGPLEPSPHARLNSSRSSALKSRPKWSTRSRTSPVSK